MNDCFSKVMDEIAEAKPEEKEEEEPEEQEDQVVMGGTAGA